MPATFQWQLDRRPLKSLLRFLSACLSTLRFEPANYGALGVRKGTQMARPCHFPPTLIRRRCFSVAFPNSCLLCYSVCGFIFYFSFFFFFVLTDCTVCSRPVVMTSKSAGLSVRCTSPWVWLPGGACIVSAGAKSITRRLYLQSNFIPPACVEDWAWSLV